MTTNSKEYGPLACHLAHCQSVCLCGRVELLPLAQGIEKRGLERRAPRHCFLAHPPPDFTRKKEETTHFTLSKTTQSSRGAQIIRMTYSLRQYTDLKTMVESEILQQM